MRNKCGIYCIENLVNGKMYVGQSISIGRRFNSHTSFLLRNTHKNIYLQRAWNKYGKNSFSFYILEECSLNDLNEKEIFWIDKLSSIIPNGYNMEFGGSCNKIVSDETRKKMSESRPNMFGKNNLMYGTKRPESVKNAVSLANKGKKSTLNIKQKNSSSDYYGVYAHGKTGRWRFGTTVDGKRFDSSKTFEIEKDAAKAYDYYIVENNLNKKLNFPEDYKYHEKHL